MIRLDDTFEGTVYVEFCANRGNWLCAVNRDVKRPGHWKLVYRTRWYRDDKIHDSDDEKNFYTVLTNEPKTLEEMRVLVRDLAKGVMVLDRTPSTHKSELWRHAGEPTRDLAKRLLSMRGMHVKTTDRETFNKMYGK